MTEASLYERLGGAFAIAAVIDHFSDAVVRSPITGQGSEDLALDEWSTDGRPPGVCSRETEQYSSRPGRSPSGAEDLSRHLRRSRG
jgi:hemoglobin